MENVALNGSLVHLKRGNVTCVPGAIFCPQTVEGAMIRLGALCLRD